MRIYQFLTTVLFVTSVRARAIGPELIPRDLWPKFNLSDPQDWWNVTIPESLTKRDVARNPDDLNSKFFGIWWHTPPDDVTGGMTAQDYTWSGSLEFGRNGYSICLRSPTGDSGKQLSTYYCGCIGNIDNVFTCNDDSINLPTDDYAWNFHGMLFKFPYHPAYLKVRIQNRATGECIQYFPPESTPVKYEEGGRIGGLEMRPCLMEESSQLFGVWIHGPKQAYT
ncbi:hypothetical protein TWF696_001737 [Orbilia brochopaga]|uniref:Uncharacterized protein n=1 Tax=Orbilia brochopaga TaxID=3140254 RepID=A0AAV9U7A3_9PEZI